MTGTRTQKSIADLFLSLRHEPATQKQMKTAASCVARGNKKDTGYNDCDPVSAPRAGDPRNRLVQGFQATASPLDEALIGHPI